MKIVFPGSFDPVTKGHLDLIQRATKLFDEVIVAILTNTSKQNLFSLDERLSFLQQATKAMPNVKVVAVKNDLTVNVVKKIGAQAILRGVRSLKDFEYEQEIALINRQLAPEIETVLLLANPEYSFLSSSMLKEVAKFNGDVTEFTSVEVAQALKRKLVQKCID